MPSLKAADRAKLAAEIAGDPKGLGYARKTAAEVFAILRTANRRRRKPGPCLVNELDVLNAFADPTDGNAFLVKLEALAAVHQTLARVLQWMAPGGERGDQAGVDVANEKLRGVLAGLAGQADVTKAEVATVLALGDELVDRLTELDLHGVRLGHVVVAMKG